MNSGLINPSKIFEKLFFWYLLSLTIIYPYGLVLSGNSLRLSDIFTCTLIAAGLICIITSRFEIPKYVGPILYVVPFIVLELIFPVFGALTVGQSEFGSSIRIVLLYIPSLLFIFMAHTSSKLIYYFEKGLKIGLIINSVYSFIQVLIYFHVLPDTLLLQKYLYIYSVDDQYKITDGIRASGFFNNGIELSIFGIISFSYFISRYFTRKSKGDLLFSFLSLTVIMLSTTRTAIMIAVLMLIMNLIFAPVSTKKKFKLFIWITTFTVLFIVILSKLVDLNELFIRITRLADGLNADVSFSNRLNNLWPDIISAAKSYPNGTMVQPYKVLGLIDSGYLSYYAQGKWLFIIALSIFILGLYILCIKRLFSSKKAWGDIFLLNILTYILASMVVYNPMRNPLLVTCIFIGIYSIILERKKEKLE